MKLKALISKKPMLLLVLTVLLIQYMSLPLRAGAAEESFFRLKPYHIQIQYAGNLGCVSAGIGKSFLNDQVHAYLIFGYLPDFIHGVSVHTRAIKVIYSPGSVPVSAKLNLAYYAGASLLYGETRNTYLVYPGYFPDGYYNTNAIHGTFMMGAKLNKAIEGSKLNKFSVFAELGTIDYQIWYAMKSRSVTALDIWNISFGIDFSID